MHEVRSNILRGERRVQLASKSSEKKTGGSLGGVRIRREEARRSDQRREGRHFQLVERAAVTFQRRTFEVAVLNVSACGAMIEADIEPRIGARLDLRFADCNRTQCFVRWVRGGRIGLEFGKETLVIAPRDVRELIAGGRRAGEQPTLAVKKEREPRQSLMLRGELHWPQGSMPVRLRNISSQGAMLEAGRDLAPDTEIVLELKGAAAAAGRVRWCRSRQIGVRFDDALDLTTLAHAQHPREEIPHMLKPDYLRSETDPDSPWAACWDRLTPDDL